MATDRGYRRSAGGFRLAVPGGERIRRCRRRPIDRRELRFGPPRSGHTWFVPLYACERCGFTSAAFRNDAAAAHRLEYPDCDGVMRIIFRSEERYRGQPRAPAAGAHAAARSTQGATCPPAQPREISRCARISMPAERFV